MSHSLRTKNAIYLIRYMTNIKIYIILFSLKILFSVGTYVLKMQFNLMHEF